MRQRCPECGVDFTVVRGSAYDAGRRFALYLIALHGHSPTGRLGHLAVGVAVDGREGERVRRAAAIDLSENDEQFGFTFVDWEQSPWRSEAYLGEMLGRAQVLADPLRGTFLHVAEHVARDLPEVREYFV